VEEDEDFIKIIEIVPDMHYVNTIVKIFEIEAVII